VNEVTGSISRVPERRVILALTVLAAVLRCVHLGLQSLWVDEMLTLTVATPKPGYPLGQLLLYNVHGPLHTLVVAIARRLSENEAWLRLPSAVAGVVAVPLLYAWVRPRFGPRTAGWAALLLAVNPLHIHYSQELRNYAFVVCFVLAGCVQLDRACAAWTRGRVTGLAALVAAAVLSNFSASFAFVAQSVCLFRSAPSPRVAFARWGMVTALVVLITAPWIYRVTTYVDFRKLATPVAPGEVADDERLRGDTTFRFEAVPYTFYAYSVGFALGPTLAEMHGDLDRVLARDRVTIAWTALVFGVLSIAGLSGALRGREGRWRVLELGLYIVVPLAATLLLNWQNAKAFNVRYVLIGLPMYLVLLARGIAGTGGRRQWVAGALVLATTAVALRGYYADPARRKEDVRAATRAVEARLAPGECIFAPTVWQIVAHYRSTDAPLHYIYRDPPGLVDRQLGELYSACPSFWYLRARPWVDDPDGRVLAALEERYRRETVLEFPGVTAIHFLPKN
jgi:4-amino-4-deoxy-L-arabinose transferase-like glycosyltransferase